MVDDWTPQEEEAWNCLTPQQTLDLAQSIKVGYIYRCTYCDDYHVSRLASPVRQLDLPLRDVPNPDRTWPTSGASEDRQDDCLGTC
ncbi:MAG: hypothetical protein RL458_2574 [Pseudomonadota bacterium]|jgi:hypothetical protein